MIEVRALCKDSRKYASERRYLVENQENSIRTGAKSLMDDVKDDFVFDLKSDGRWGSKDGEPW